MKLLYHAFLLFIFLIVYTPNVECGWQEEQIKSNYGPPATHSQTKCDEKNKGTYAVMSPKWITDHKGNTLCCKYHQVYKSLFNNKDGSPNEKSYCNNKCDKGKSPLAIRVDGVCSTKLYPEEHKNTDFITDIKACREQGRKLGIFEPSPASGADTVRSTNKPYGCYFSGQHFYVNRDTRSKAECTKSSACICPTTAENVDSCKKCKYDCRPGWEPADLTNCKCEKCKHHRFNAIGGETKCKWCPKHLTSNNGRTKCIASNENLAISVNNIEKAIAGMKEKKEESVSKLSRLWQKETIRLEHDKIMATRKNKDNQNVKDFCERERKREYGTVIFPAVEISQEIEKIEDTTCIDTNRDELLKSFCSFTSDLDGLFKIQGVDKQAKSFWPNICCKQRRDEVLEECEDPSGEINRTDIIPFALSQGGNYSRHNLYMEVMDAIKMEGYIHKGMNMLIDSLLHSVDKANILKEVISSFFKDISLCGPRIVDAPKNSERKLCELFVPYPHTMKHFYNLIESLYMQPAPIQTSSFLETMERSLRKRQLSSKRIGKNNIQNTMQMKPMQKAVEATCTGGSQWVSHKLKQKKKEYCLGYSHLDLSNTNIKNVAVHYLKNDVVYNDKEMFRLSKQLRYQVTDTSCPAPLFTAEDISIQQVAMDVLGKEQAWVAVVSLNTKDDNGYLQSELPSCENRNYLIGTKVKVEAYEDKEDCCKNFKDYKKCESMEENVRCLKKTQNNGECVEFETRKKCEGKLEKLKDKHHNHYSKDIKLTGTQYTVGNSRRRRRLLMGHQQGC